MPSWTKEQLEAIHRHGENIIVSAGAGSGKTAVLTERIITELKNGVHLNQLLVLTFTNAAAHEMKERIRKSISKIPELKEELDFLDLAYITTFDSFALSVVKKYHYLLNIKPDVGIIEASVMELKKRELLREITDEYYAKKDPLFAKLIHDFALKDDQAVLNGILSIYRKLELLYDKNAFIKDYFGVYFSDTFIEDKIDEYLDVCDKRKTTIQMYLKNLEYEVDGTYYEKVKEALEPLLSTEDHQLYTGLDEIKIPNVPKNSPERVKELKSLLTKNISELKELVKYSSIEEMKNEIQMTKEYVQIILEIIQKLDDKLVAYKRKYDLYEFGDIATLAIRLVKEEKLVKQEFKDTFHEILVDEYQDTSDLQEMFLKEIAHNNLYMVGDMKQSIYRFRNANPKIFKEKYDSYSVNEGGSKIDLNKNFRSRNTVLSGINHIFNLIMDHEIGGADYEKEHQLIFGNLSYTNQGSTKQNMDLEILDYHCDKDSKESIFSSVEIEAFLIAKDMKEKVESHYQVFDKDEGVLRDITYSDFAVLVDQKKHFDLYKKIFTYFNIPSEIHKEEILNDSKVITAIKNILLLITSKKMDAQAKYYYTSIARSFLFPYEDAEIMERITNQQFQNDLIMEKIYLLRKQFSSMTPSEMIEAIVETFSFYEKIITIGEVDSEISRIDHLLELATSMEKLGYDTMQFSKMLVSLKEEDIAIKFSTKLSNQDVIKAVKIMTIHKSKGLEFYVCYFPELSNRFNLREVVDRFTFSNLYGVITPFYQDGIRSTIYPTLLKERYLKEEISEKLRVFYVALTRAKEKVILLTDLSKETVSFKEEKIVSNQNRMQYRSFQDLLLSIKEELEPFITPCDLTQLHLTRAYQKQIQNMKVENLEYEQSIVQKEIEVSTEILEQKKYSHQMKKMNTYEENLVLEAGNMLHYALEVLNLKEPNISSLPVTDTVKTVIYKFLNQDIVSDIEQAAIYQEYEFIYEDEMEVGHGIIDLLLEYPDKIKIIDYKLKNIEPDYYETQLKGYQKYLSKITEKPVELYLYSLLEGNYRKIEGENHA